MGLLRALVTSVFLYGCETWTLNAEIEKRINALHAHYTSHTFNKQVRELIFKEYSMILTTSYYGMNEKIKTK